MVDLECPRRRWSARTLGIWLGFFVSTSLADPAAVTPRWLVSFSAATNGKTAESTAVPVEGDSTLVVVVAVGADPVEFVEAFLSNYPRGNWISREQERLTTAITRVEADQAS